MTYREKYNEIKNKLIESGSLTFEEWAARGFNKDQSVKTLNAIQYSGQQGHGLFRYYVDILCGVVKPAYKESELHEYAELYQIYNTTKTLVNAYVNYCDDAFEFFEENPDLLENTLSFETYQKENAGANNYLLNKFKIDYDEEDKLSFSDLKITNELGISYEGCSFLYATKGNRMVMNRIANEKILWLLILDTLDKSEIQSIAGELTLPTKLENDQIAFDLIVSLSRRGNFTVSKNEAIDNYDINVEDRKFINDKKDGNCLVLEAKPTKQIISRGIIAKAFKHPLFELSYPLTFQATKNFSKNLERSRKLSYEKQYALAKSSKNNYMEGKRASLLHNFPYTCGYDFNLALLAYTIGHRFMTVDELYETNHTQAGMADFMGFKSLQQLKTYKTFLENKILNETFDYFEERYLEDVKGSYMAYIETFEEMQNLILGSLESALQNYNARNLHGVIFSAQSLERNSFLEKVEEKEENIVTVNFNSNMFDSGN